MKTHENRALFCRTLLKATTCLFLTTGIGISAAYAAPRENTQTTSIVQYNKTALSMVRLQMQMENPSLVLVL